MNVFLIVAVLLTSILLLWGLLALVAHIGGRRFDREWGAMSDEERRRTQERLYKAKI